MCSIIAVAISATAAGTLLTAFSQIQAGKAQQDAADFQASVLRNQAIEAGQIGAEQERQSAEQQKQLQGLQTVALAGSGQLVGTGSALETIADTAKVGAFDRELIKQRTKSAQQGLISNAELLEFQGDAAASAGLLSAGGTLLSGLGQLGIVAAKWKSFNGNPNELSTFGAIT